MANSTLVTIDRFLSQVSAAEKRAEANTETGSIGGETKHPVKNEDDRTEEAKEGFRSAENSEDVKEDQGKPGVDNTSEAKTANYNPFMRFAKPMRKQAEGTVSTPGSATDDHLNIGVKVAPTGEDPSTETESAKAGKEDPGSSHPARTDNDELDGHKYASADLENMPIEQLAKIAADANESLTQLLLSQVNQPEKTSTKQAAAASQAGTALADAVTGGLNKQAVDEILQERMEEIIKQAADDASNVLDYLAGHFSKQAEGGPPMGGPPMGAPPMGGPPMGDGDGDEAMMAAMAGGAGGDPGGAPGGAPGPEDAARLLQILTEAGISVDDLEAILAGGGEGGPDMGAPEGGMEAGPAPEPEPPMPEEGKQAADKQAQEEGRNYMLELIARSTRR